MKKKTTSVLAFIIGGIPILIYPFVFTANIMTLAGQWTGKENFILKTIIYAFLFFSSIYPLTYITCLLIYFFKKGVKNTLFSIIPLIQVVIIVFLGFVWSLLQNLSR